MGASSGEIDIRPAVFGALLEDVRVLFREYQASLGIDLAFQGFEEELAALPGHYAPPSGRLYVAIVDGRPAGCIGLRHFDDGRCEMKRLYVRPGYRGLAIGRLLATRVVTDARAIGYTAMLLDTLPSMETAQRLYRSLGFQDCEPYRFNPVAGTRFMRLGLATATPEGPRDA
jgi:ribosomal protein S18 acetylase RimI-like enzyme